MDEATITLRIHTNDRDRDHAMRDGGTGLLLRILIASGVVHEAVANAIIAAYYAEQKESNRLAAERRKENDRLRNLGG
jgi:hypothetical protein